MHRPSLLGALFGALLLSPAAASAEDRAGLEAHYGAVERAVYTVEAVTQPGVGLATYGSVAPEPIRRRWRVHFDRKRGVRVVGQLEGHRSEMWLGRRAQGTLAHCVEHPVDEAFAPAEGHRCLYEDDTDLTAERLGDMAEDDLVLQLLWGTWHPLDLAPDEPEPSDEAGAELRRRIEEAREATSALLAGLKPKVTPRLDQAGALLGWRVVAGNPLVGTSTTTCTLVGFEQPGVIADEVFVRPPAAEASRWRDFSKRLASVKRLRYEVTLKTETRFLETTTETERRRVVFVRGEGFRAERVEGGGPESRLVVGHGGSVTVCETASSTPHLCEPGPCEGTEADSMLAVGPEPLLLLLRGGEPAIWWASAPWVPTGDGWWSPRPEGRNPYLEIRLDEEGRVTGFREVSGGLMGVWISKEARLSGFEDPGEVPAETFRLDPEIHQEP